MLGAVVNLFDKGPPRLAGVVRPRAVAGSGPAGSGPAGSGPAASEPQHFGPIVRTVVAAVMRLPHGHPDVDDGVSETMRRALEGRARLRDGEPLRPWMLGIARHVAVDALRKRGRERPVANASERDSSGDVSVFDTIADSSPSPHDRFEAADQSSRVRRAMSDLPEGMREALTLFYVEGLAYDAIALRMGIPLGTVATWIARGRKTLTERMESFERSPR